MNNFDKFIREIKEINYFADSSLSESKIITEGKFAFDSSILKTIGIGIISTTIGAIITKLIDIQFQKKELKRRIKRQQDNKDLQDKFDLLKKSEDQLYVELKRSEAKLNRTSSAVDIVKNKFLKKQLKKTIDAENEKISIIKNQLKAIKDD